MSLIYIANARMPTEKAHGLQIVKMCEAFGKQNIKTRLIVPKRFNYIKKNIFDYYGINKNFEITKLPCLDLVQLGKIGFWAEALTFFTSAFFYALFQKDSIIYTREILLAFILSFFKKNVVFEDHEPPRSKLWLYKICLKKIPKKIIVANNLAKIYDNFGIKKDSYLIAPNGVDIDQFKQIKIDKNLWSKNFGLEKDEKIVLYVGHFYKWKGVYTLLEAAKYLDKKTKIVLIGGIKEDIRKVQKYIQENNLNNIFLHDFIPHKKVIKYLKSADVLVLPNTAQEERSAKYTTPIKMFEYMASGVPIVASNLESFQNYLKNNKNALLFEPDNPKDLALKVNHLLQDKPLAKNLSQKALGSIQEYSWEKRAKNILKFSEKQSI